MLNALSNTNLGPDGVFKGSQAEGKGWESLVGLCEELTRLLQLKVVLVLKLAFVDSSPLLRKFGFALTGGNVDIQMNDFTRNESPVFNVLLRRLFANNHLVRVDAVFFDSVR